MYMQVFGHQTTTDISPGHNVPHITGEVVILVPKNKKYKLLNKCFVVEIFTPYSHNLYAILGV